ncbi:hypothetical protein FGO68_gene9652 [Halteria grandinella]|uniref:Uncharacterized protein n=1 Tax=Halteria grandinella TaxID=5974 RepID=A0A8J8NG71_HALGN|nr:hypothetical protein FGO68_gene9652 [Halteria grandinella]
MKCIIIIKQENKRNLYLTQQPFTFKTVRNNEFDVPRGLQEFLEQGQEKRVRMMEMPQRSTRTALSWAMQLRQLFRKCSRTRRMTLTKRYPSTSKNS